MGKNQRTNNEDYNGKPLNCFYDAKPTKDEAKIMKEISDETDKELAHLRHKYDPDCINNLFEHYCKNPKGSPCEK